MSIIEKTTLRVPEGVRDYSGIGIQRVLQAARSGELPTLKPGRERLARIVDVDVWIAGMVQHGYTAQQSAKAKNLGPCATPKTRPDMRGVPPVGRGQKRTVKR